VGTTIESAAVVVGRGRRGSARKLADRAIKEALVVAGIEAGRIDLILNAGIFHDRLLGEPALAALIQEDVAANPEDPHGDGHGSFSFDVANGAAGPLSAMHIADGFLRAGTIGRAVIVAGDADPGHGLAPDFPYDPVGAALVCGWDPGEAGLAGFRWATVPQEPARRRATVQFEQGRNRLHLCEDEGFAAEAAGAAAAVVGRLLGEHGVTPDAVAAVAVAPFETAFVDELADRCGVPADRFARPEPGPRLHTAGLVAALQQVTSSPPPAGDWVLLVAAGAGISAGAALLRR
jgi:3-oxoacyl-[acyl-carrier-protein] synthase-3